MNLVITIGRSFGSGGRHLGQLLATRLNIGYYDKELLTEAARRSGVRTEFFEINDERSPSFFTGLFSFSMGYSPVHYYAGATSIGDDGIYKAQSELIQHLADQGPCVIVGRASDYVLRNHGKLLSIFVHAPIESCVDRIIERQPELSRKEARQLAEKTNKLRSNYYNFYTDHKWGDASTYDLCFDTSKMKLEDIVEIIIDYINRRWTGEGVL